MANANENGSVEPIENVSIFILNIADTFVVFYCTAALQVDKSIYIFFFSEIYFFFLRTPSNINQTAVGLC